MSSKVNLLTKIKMEMNVEDTDPNPREMNTLTMVSDQDYFGDYDELNLPQENNIKNEITIEEFDFAKAIQQYEVKMENLNVISSAPDIKGEFIVKETTTTVTGNLKNKNLPTVLSKESAKTIDCGNKFHNTKVPTDKIPNNKQTFACTKCEKVFVRKVNFKSHIRSHSGEKPFTCDYCETAFIYKANLNRHIRIHTGVKPFPCTHCEKAFVRKDNLKLHIRMHTGVKPFACTYCDKVFTCKNQLKRHIKIHTGGKPFGCTHCGKAFVRKDNLKAHIKIHTGEKPFTCKTQINI